MFFRLSPARLIACSSARSALSWSAICRSRRSARSHSFTTRVRFNGKISVRFLRISRTGEHLKSPYPTLARGERDLGLGGRKKIGSRSNETLEFHTTPAGGRPVYKYALFVVGFTGRDARKQSSTDVLSNMQVRKVPFIQNPGTIQRKDFAKIRGRIIRVLSNTYVLFAPCFFRLSPDRLIACSSARSALWSHDLSIMEIPGEV